MNPPAWEQSGPATAPAVLLLHGFMGSRRDWDPVVAVLARTRRCLAVDLPWHGETGAPDAGGPVTPEACVAALADLLRDLGGGSVAGYSLGGRLALQLAIEYPDVVRRAVIVSSSPGIARETDRARRREEDERRARRLEIRGLEAFLGDWYHQPLFATLRERPQFCAILERRRRNDPRLLASSLRQMGAGTQRPLWGELSGATTPLLFLAGEGDPKYTALAFEAVALCRHGEAVILRGCGHALVEEDPEAVARETEAFLAGS